MNTTTTTPEIPMPKYLQDLVKDNYLLIQEAQAISRLPVSLQEQAIQQSESLRIKTVNTIVFDLLNPKPPERPLKAWEACISLPFAALFFYSFITSFFGTLWKIGVWSWHTLGSVLSLILHLLRSSP